MRLYISACITAMCVSLGACGVVEPTSTAEQPGMNLQGMNLQGMNLQGMNLQGMNLQGFRLGSATLSGATLKNLRVERGELVAERGLITLRGTALIDAQLQGQAQNLGVSPPTTTVVTYRIANIVAESSTYDPTRTGSTFLYTLEQRIDTNGSWEPACAPDADGRRVAIPLAATWNEQGDRIESSSLFTMSCTTGVIAKCYRWGYRPWITGYGSNMAMMHWTCTRLARADYCGNGQSHTLDDTLINVWDDLPLPGPIQKHGGLSPLIPPAGMIFEAGWSTAGAVCLSHNRWTKLADLITLICPDRLLLPSLGGIACNDMFQVQLLYPTAHMFNESLNLDPL